MTVIAVIIILVVIGIVTARRSRGTSLALVFARVRILTGAIGRAILSIVVTTTSIGIAASPWVS